MTPNDKLERVRLMLLDQNQTWDLSPNDRDALRHVLGLVMSMADEIARQDGWTVGHALRRHHQIVAREQAE